MENTLTAKEWFEKENKEGILCSYPVTLRLLEEYATYRNKVLQGEIMLFSLQLNTIAKSAPYDGILKDIKVQFDEHFGITSIREGKIS